MRAPCETHGSISEIFLVRMVSSTRQRIAGFGDIFGRIMNSFPKS